MTSERKCENCRYADPQEEERGMFTCLRYPPQIARNDEGESVCCFPQVRARDWCGEFRYRLQKLS